MNSESLSLKTSASVLNFKHNLLLKVITFGDFISTGEYGSEYCILFEEYISDIKIITTLEWGGIIFLYEFIDDKRIHIPVVFNLKQPEIITSGDVISILINRVDVLYRRRSDSNMLFVTERCNHQCIMCAQPPKSTDDRWRVSESHSVIDLIDKSEPILGISGGEPTLLDDDLVSIIGHCKDSLPNTCIHVLSNGVAFSDKSFAEKISNIEHPNLLWGIPIYGCSAQQHDFHTQVLGSFNQTIHGLYNLSLFSQVIELRVVLTKMVLMNIRPILEFILWNLPFVNSVALMGIEPTGYARLNHSIVWDELDEYRDELCHSINYLRHSSINIFLYNVPLCYLPSELHPIAIRSISDWKISYEPECFVCQKKDQCCGFFKSHRARFTRRNVVPFKQII
jgi:His-Xaa-Ser system radical SAM maturase HxsC